MVFFSLCLPVEFDLIVQKRGFTLTGVRARHAGFSSEMMLSKSACYRSGRDVYIGRRRVQAMVLPPQDKPVFPANEMRKV